MKRKEKKWDLDERFYLDYKCNPRYYCKVYKCNPRDCRGINVRARSRLAHDPSELIPLPLFLTATDSRVKDAETTLPLVTHGLLRLIIVTRKRTERVLVARLCSTVSTSLLIPILPKKRSLREIRNKELAPLYYLSLWQREMYCLDEMYFRKDKLSYILYELRVEKLLF